MCTGAQVSAVEPHAASDRGAKCYSTTPGAAAMTLPAIPSPGDEAVGLHRGRPCHHLGEKHPRQEPHKHQGRSNLGLGTAPSVCHHGEPPMWDPHRV